MNEVERSLSEQWNDLLEQQPNIRIRNAANTLNCSEVELLALKCGKQVLRLNNDFIGILEKIPTLGYVMALTRNNDAVHERKGIYQNWRFSPHACLFVGADIDLRIFLNNWKSVFSVTEGEGDKLRRSLQFFDRSGMAIHKIYLTKKSNVEAFNSLIKQYLSPDQSTLEHIENIEKSHEELPDNMIDIINFKKEWLELRDTHDFHMLLRKYKVNRTQALRLAPNGNYAKKLSNKALRSLFEHVSENKVPIMVFVGNKGMIQIHTGEINKLIDHEQWFNVMDAEFNLHLNEKAIAETWVVRKPTLDGIVTSMELYDSHGVQIASIFGKRKPGIPELQEWRSSINTIEKELVN